MQEILRAKWFLFLKWALAIISFFYILYHITSKAGHISLSTICSVLNNCNTKSESFIILVILMLLNWAIESFKWKVLIEEIENINFLKSVRAVFTGITLSFYSPNRSGEFVGRVMHLEPGHRVEASLLTFIGSICQLTFTLQAGLFALMYYSLPLSSVRIFRGFDLSLLIIVAFILLSFVVLFNAPNWLNKLKNFKILHKYIDRFKVLQNISMQKLIFVYALSALRYAVFSFQFYLLLRICGIELSLTAMACNIAISFMLTSVIPSIALGELGVRGSVNLQLFSVNHLNDTAVLVASFLLWLINLAVPALIGAISSFYIRWNNSEK